MRSGGRQDYVLFTEPKSKGPSGSFRQAACRKYPGVLRLPTHLYGVGSPVRVLNTRPTIPGGGLVSGTPKGPRGLRYDVPASCARFASEFESHSSRWSPNVTIRPRGGREVRPLPEWCRLPYGVDSRVKIPRY